MSKIKQVLAFLTAAVLTCSASVALTAAYLTDRDSEANVFTVGDVTIDLLGKFDDEPVLLPGIPVDDPASVKNIGKNEAWIWATVAYPKALDPVVRLDTDATGVWSKLNTATAEKDGAEYSLVTYLHNAPVAPGAETAPFLLSAALDSRVDITPDGDWYLVEAGDPTSIGWNSSTGGLPTVLVSAYAIQTEGFADAKAGYDAYQAQWGDKGTEWGDVTVDPGEEPDTPAEPAVQWTEVDTEEELIAAFTTGGNIRVVADITAAQAIMPTEAPAAPIVLDLNGKTVNAYIYLKNTDLTVKDSASGGKIKSAPPLSISGGKLTVESGIFDCMISLSDDAEVVIKGGTFEKKIETSRTSLEITGGTFSNIVINTSSTVRIKDGIFNGWISSQSGSSLEITDGTFNGNIQSEADSNFISSIIVSGGTFNAQDYTYNTGNFTATGGTFNMIPAEYVASGHEAVQNTDGSWTVVKKVMKEYQIAGGTYVLSCEEELTSGTDYVYTDYAATLEIKTTKPVTLSMGSGEINPLQLELYDNVNFTLDSVKIKTAGNQVPLAVDKNVTVKLVGESTLEAEDQTAIRLFKEDSLTITSDCGGKLTVKSNSVGIYGSNSNPVTVSGDACVTVIATPPTSGVVVTTKDSATFI